MTPRNTKFQGKPLQLHGPLIFGMGKLSMNQPTKSAVILLKREDLNKLDRIMKANAHKGAFGSDFDSYSTPYYPDIDTVLWKIPGDILDIRGLNACLLDNIGLQVGTDPSWIDAWSENLSKEEMITIRDNTFSDNTFTREDSKKNRISATWLTKLRFDFSDSESCHVLTNLKTGATFPMLGTHFHFTYHWDGDYKEEKENLEEERKDYLDAIVKLQKIGVEALSIRGQQHALVFVELNGEPITMEAFITFLKVNKEKMKFALELDEEHWFEDWFESYVRFDMAAFKINRWHQTVK